jgi:hypothetical protein
VGRAEADNELGGVRIERDGELLRQLAAERRHGSVLGVTQSEASAASRKAATRKRLAGDADACSRRGRELLRASL